MYPCNSIISTSFFLMLNNIPVPESTTFTYPLISGWTFGYFYFGAILNNAAMHICVCKFVWKYVFIFLSVYLGNIASCGNSMSNFLRNCQIIFQNSYTILHFPQQCMRVLISPHPPQHLLLSVVSSSSSSSLPTISQCLMMLSILEFADWLFACRLWRNVCS